jgi:hypothetical protein
MIRPRFELLTRPASAAHYFPAYFAFSEGRPRLHAGALDLKKNRKKKNTPNQKAEARRVLIMTSRIGC